MTTKKKLSCLRFGCPVNDMYIESSRIRITKATAPSASAPATLRTGLMLSRLGKKRMHQASSQWRKANGSKMNFALIIVSQLSFGQACKLGQQLVLVLPLE